jgi:D-glycero-D-manno-heptose 1,7-bisphosphate phosphatase
LRKAIFLDRDGVLNQTIFRNGKPRAPYTLEEFVLFDGVPQAITQLRNLNYLLIVVTNQPDVARGWVSRDAVDLVNNKLRELVLVDDIKICFHTDQENCQCRKPKPGMLLKATEEWDIDLTQSFMIGDRHSDIEAGKSAGCKTVLIGHADQSSSVVPDFQMNSLLEAALCISKIDL